MDHNACAVDIKQRMIDAWNVTNDAEFENTY